MANLTKRRPEKEAAFLNELSEGNSVHAACKAAGIGRQTVYEWRKADDAFRAAWEDAIEAGTDRLEDEAVRRALDGSDTLLIFMLKARRPDTYRESIHVSGDHHVHHSIGEAFDFNGIRDVRAGKSPRPIPQPTKH